jgi:hypothetical protein
MRALCLAVALMCGAGTAVAADPVGIALNGDPGNPSDPQMGDNLSFHSVIRNAGTTAVEGLVAWLSLIEIDPGNEQPMDLEDWSAHKAITVPSLAPGEVFQADWPMRLIQAGRYRVVINAMSRDGNGIATSPFSDFTVREKAVVESARVLPVAFGVPVLLSLLLLWRWRRQRR